MNFAPLAGWLLSIALHGGLLLAAAWLIDRAVRLAPSTRELMWRYALFGGVFTASLQAFIPTSPQAWHLALPAAATTSAPEPTLPGTTSAETPTFASTRAASLADSASPVDETSQAASPDTVAVPSNPVPRSASAVMSFLPSLPITVLIFWLSGAMLTFARLGTRFADLRRALARAKPAIPPADPDLAALAHRAGVRMPALYTLPDVASPFAFGRRIVVPEWAPAALDPRQLHAMLAHELAHIARRDPQWKLIVECWRAGFWFLPFAGLAQRRLDELAELACDAFAARQTGDAHAVAECLAACAERHFDSRAYALMPAMAARGSTLIQRIDRLLEGTAMSTTKPGFLLRAATAAVLTVGAFGLPSVGFLSPVARAQTPPQPPAPPTASKTRSSISITSNDDSHDMRVIVEDDRRGLSLDVKGKIEFTPDETDIASLSVGGTATLEEKRDGTTHRLELAERNGQLERRYFVDRREQPFDAAAHSWLAALLPNLIRESGLGADARVARIYAAGGAAAVLAEIDLVHSDYVRGLYLGLLVGKGPLSKTDLDHCLRLAGSIGGDYEKHQALARIFAKQKLDAAQQLAFLQQASHIGGGYELAEVLTGILPGLADTAEVRASWLNLATHIDGDYERARTLQALLERRDPNDGELTTLLHASNAVSGAYEHSQLLIAIAKRARNVDAIAPAYAQSTLKVGGDYERCQALLALIQTGKLGAPGANAVLDAATKINGDYERSQILVALASSMPNDAALVAHYHQVASNLAKYERDQAESALRY